MKSWAIKAAIIGIAVAIGVNVPHRMIAVAQTTETAASDAPHDAGTVNLLGVVASRDLLSARDDANAIDWRQGRG